MSEPFLAEIVMFGGNFAPRSWAFCDGQLLPIAQNSALFSLLGTIYGGDGRTTFALPEMRGRAAIHAGRGPGLTDRRLGSRGGQETVTLNITTMPSHNHFASTTTTTTTTVGAIDDDANSPDVDGAFPANSTIGDIYGTGTPDGSLGGVSSVSQSQTTVNNAGGNQAHANMMPYCTVNYIIALQGTFPSRS